MYFANLLKFIIGFLVGGACGITTVVCLRVSKKKAVRCSCVAITMALVVLVALVASSVAMLFGEIVGFMSIMVVVPLAIASSDMNRRLSHNVE